VRRGAPGDAARAEELVAAASADIVSSGFAYLARRAREILQQHRAGAPEATSHGGDADRYAPA